MHFFFRGIPRDDKRREAHHIIRRPGFPISSPTGRSPSPTFLRSRDRRGQRLRRRWSSLLRPTTRALQPAPFLLTLLLPVPRSPSPFIVLSATLSRQKEKHNLAATILSTLRRRKVASSTGKDIAGGGSGGGGGGGGGACSVISPSSFRVGGGVGDEARSNHQSGSSLHRGKAMENRPLRRRVLHNNHNLLLLLLHLHILLLRLSATFH